MATIPSLAMIPSGYKATKLYSVLPTTGEGDLNFTRTSEATRVNQIGLIETSSTGVPRLNYTDGGCPSLLMENASTNSVTESETLTAWTSLNLNVTDNVGLSLRGEVDSSELVADLTNGEHQISRPQNFVAGQSYTVSLFFKANGINRVNILAGNQGAVPFNATFNLQNETFTAALGTAKIDKEDNGWYRCIISFTAISSTATNVIVKLVNDSNQTTFVGNGVDGAFIWGVQLEDFLFETSYIPTNGIPVTRTIDSASKGGLSAFMNNSNLTLYFELERRAIDQNINGRCISLYNADLTVEQIRFHFDSPADTMRFRDGLNAFATISGNIDGLVGTLAKIAFSLDELGNIIVSVNGSKIGSTYVSAGSFDFGGITITGQNEEIKYFEIKNTTLSEVELNNLTTL